MNYNAKYGDRTAAVRRTQRVSDVGYSSPQSYPSNAFYPDPNYDHQLESNSSLSSNAAFGIPNQQSDYYQPTVPINPYYDQPKNPYYPNNNASAPPHSPTGPAIFNPSNVHTNVPNQFSMLDQPMVQGMALEYGQRLADQGKQLVETQFEKYIPVTRLKYYFAVDNNYVIKKIILILFPFTHRDWSMKYDHDNPVQPRYDLNAPDLYIPTMAYITFIVLTGFVMGMQNQFTPERLGVISSSALAYSIFELIIYSIMLYISNISTSLKTLDLMAFSGYKFVTLNFCILFSIIFKRFGFYLALIYTSITLCFFLLRTLKAKILHEGSTSTVTSYDAYGNIQQSEVHADYLIGRKRKLYFLFLISFAQPILAFFLFMHLIPSKMIEVTSSI